MKKFVAAMLCVILMGTMLGAPALADPKHVDADTLKQMVASANQQILDLVHYAQSTEADDVAWMQREVRKVVQKVQSYAKKCRLEVACTYVSYYIDGRWVDVDPLMVVNI